MLGAGTMQACLSPMEPGASDVAEVRVTVGDKGRTEDTIQVRATRRVRAVAIAQEGFDLGVTRFTYASSNTDVAVVDEVGTVRGVSPGTATITATAPGGMSGSARVVVVPSTIAYTIDVGGAPGAIAFSPDYTKAYVVAGGTNIAIVDALGFFRVQTVALGQAIGDVASTATSVYATHPGQNAISVIDAGTKTVRAQLQVGGGPSEIVAAGPGAVVALRGERRLIGLSDAGVSGELRLDGEPEQLAASRTGRVFVTVNANGQWWLEAASAAPFRSLGRVSLPAPALDVAASHDGGRALVLLANGTLLEVLASDAGALSAARTVSAPSGSAGVDLRDGAMPLVVLSGTPLQILNGSTLGLEESIANGGTGRVVVRPDGLFAFVGAGSSGLVHVIRL